MTGTLRRRGALAAALVALLCATATAQTAATQTPVIDGGAPPQLADGAAHEAALSGVPSPYPALVTDSYIGLNIGLMNYRFSSRQLEPGFSVDSVEIPNRSARVTLFGHRFSEHLAAELVYMRPTNWVHYSGVGGQPWAHSVWMNVAGVTVRPSLPLGRRVSVFAQGGPGLITRRGFTVEGATAVRSQVSLGVLFGGGVDYHLNRRWDLTADLLSARSLADPIQPVTTNLSSGFRYTMRPPSAERALAAARAGVVFPAHLLQVEYSDRLLGYRMNDLFVKRVPIFWGGNVEMARGLAVHYVKNVMHTPRVFALDLGLSAGSWHSRAAGNSFITLSAYPVARFTFLRTSQADVYFMYSAAGPSYVSKPVIDGQQVGRGFTFQDFLGFGGFLGARKNLSAQVKITHYSNGNLLTENAGIKVPMTISLGYAF